MNIRGLLIGWLLVCGGLVSGEPGSADLLTLGQARQAWVAQASSAADKGDWKAASQALRKAVLADPKDIQVLHFYAYALFRNGQCAEAAQRYHIIRETDPDSLEACWYLARALHGMKYYRVAQGVLAGISKCAPRTRDLPWAVRDEKGTLLEGTSLAARVRLLDAECFLRQGIALNHQKRPDAASVAIESALGIVSSPMESDSEEAVLAERLYIKASALMEKQTYQEARAVFEDLISTCAGHRLAPKARLQAIICLEKEGKREEAFPLYEGLIADKADSEEAAEALLRMGYYCYNQREYSECREYFSRFLRAFPRHERVAEVDFKRGLTLSLQESFMEAGEHFRSFGQRHPGSDQIPAALYWAGDAYLKAGDATRSSEMFKRTIAEYPETKWAKFAKGRLARLGEQSEWIQPVP